MDGCNGKLLLAKQQFDAILVNFSEQPEQKEQFLRWVRHRLRGENGVAKTMVHGGKLHSNLAARKQLGRIAKRLRELTPLEYCLDIALADDEKQQQQRHNCPSTAAEAKVPNPTTALLTETEASSSTTTAANDHQQQHPHQQHLVWPVAGAFADCSAQNTLHVDAFLFDDDDVDQLASDGILRRHFCTKCRSTEVGQFNLISHSLTIDELHHLFTVRLSSLDGKVLVDIGSRLGTVLYAAALYCPRIGRAIGIERDPFLYELQCQIVAEFSHCLSPAVELRCADVRDVGTTTTDGQADDDDILASADVVIMNNVFTFFADHAEQVSCWRHLRAHLRPGALLLHSPSLELVTAHLCPTDLGFAFDDWLQTLHIGTAARSTAVSVGTDTFSVYRIVANK